MTLSVADATVVHAAGVATAPVVVTLLLLGLAVSVIVNVYVM